MKINIVTIIQLLSPETLQLLSATSLVLVFKITPTQLSILFLKKKIPNPTTEKNKGLNYSDEVYSKNTTYILH